MRDKLTEIVAVLVALVMLVSCGALGIADHSTNNVSFDDSLPAENLTDSPYYRMLIDDVGHLDLHLDFMRGYEFLFFIVDTFISGEDNFYLILNEF
ncbi:MAG: hypothetical protein WAV32_00305 [Halobacteriota archaeon]